MTLFILDITLDDGIRFDLDYPSVVDCLDDGGLQTLFDGGHVKECKLRSGDTHIPTGPILTRERLKQRLASNLPDLLRRRA